MNCSFARYTYFTPLRSALALIVTYSNKPNIVIDLNAYVKRLQSYHSRLPIETRSNDNPLITFRALRALDQITAPPFKKVPEGTAIIYRTL